MLFFLLFVQSFPVPQVIDARYIGVDCTYTNDSSSALNKLTDNETGFGGTLTGATLIFPPGCRIKLFSTWKIVNQSSFTIQGAGRGTAPYSGTSTMISYCGTSASVPVIDMESTFGGELSNLVIETQGSGCIVGANVGVVVDKANSHSSVNSTDNYLHDLTITTNLSGGVGSIGWTGLSISPASQSNVEDTRLWNSRINCQSTANGSIGVNLNGSFNAKLEDFKHNQITGCAYGYQQANGNWSIDGGDMAGNGADVNLGAGSDPALITSIVSESNQAFSASAANNWPNTLIANHVGWASGSTGLCGMDFGSWGAGAGKYVLIGNGSDNAPNSALSWCASQNQHILDIAGEWNQNAVPFSALGNFQANKSIGKDYGSIVGGVFRATNAAPGSVATSQNVGYGFYSHSGYEMLGLGFNANGNVDCTFPGGLCVGTDAIFLGNQNIEISGLWPIPQYMQHCIYTGAPGNVHWTIEVLAIDIAGKRSGRFPFGANWGCYNAASTLDSNDFMTVTWPRVNDAVNYAVILINPANNTQGEIISTVPDSGSGLTQSTIIASGSTTDTFSYSWPNFWESAQTTINGESLIVNAPTIFTIGGSANKTVCWKADAKSLGFCSSQPDNTGGCICN